MIVQYIKHVWVRVMRGELMRLERNVDLFLNVKQTVKQAVPDGAAKTVTMQTESIELYYKVNGVGDLEVIEGLSPVSFTYCGAGSFEIKYAPDRGEEISIITGVLSKKQIGRLRSDIYDFYTVGVNIQGEAIYIFGQSTSDPNDFEGWVGNILTSILEAV